jgi:hypothetical protein
MIQKMMEGIHLRKQGFYRTVFKARNEHSRCFKHSSLMMFRVKVTLENESE